MLQQMLTEDKADMVREAVVKSLGIIMGYIDDPDKYSQVCVYVRTFYCHPAFNCHVTSTVPFAVETVF